MSVETVTYAVRCAGTCIQKQNKSKIPVVCKAPTPGVLPPDLGFLVLGFWVFQTKNWGFQGKSRLANIQI